MSPLSARLQCMLAGGSARRWTRLQVMNAMPLASCRWLPERQVLELWSRTCTRASFWRWSCWSLCFRTSLRTGAMSAQR